MFRFLRRIRKSLIEEGNLSRYFVYAAGEIFLIVLGILIALSISNWNEGQKRTQLSQALLGELRDNLTEDLEDMRANVRYYTRSMNAAETILSAFESNLPEHDSLNKYYARVALVPQFLPTKTAYQSIQNEGVRIIENDSLRKVVLNHYEGYYTFLTRYSEAEWQTSMQDYNTLYRDKFKSMTSTLGEMLPVDYNELKNDAAYRNYLNNRLGMSISIVGLYESNIWQIERLIDAVERELSQL